MSKNRRSRRAQQDSKSDSRSGSKSKPKKAHQEIAQEIPQNPDQNISSAQVIGAEADIVHPLDDTLDNGKLVVGHRTKTLHYNSPYPPPEVLELYEQVSPGSVERIINMAEKEQAHSHTIELTALKAMKAEKRRGQRFGLTACILALGITAYALHLNHPAAATVIGGATLVSIVGIFVVGRKQRQNESKRNKAA